MNFDPNWPQFGDELTSVRLRGQWNSLDAKIAAIPAGPPGPPGPAFANAIVDSVSTLDPGQPATVTVNYDGINVHFDFGIPRGADGLNGNDGATGPKGDTGDKGDKGDKGDQGDVNLQQLNDAISNVLANSSANTNGVGLIDTSGIGDPVQLMLADKINELISAQRR